MEFDLRFINGVDIRFLNRIYEQICYFKARIQVFFFFGLVLISLYINIEDWRWGGFCFCLGLRRQYGMFGYLN